VTLVRSARSPAQIVSAGDHERVTDEERRGDPSTTRDTTAPVLAPDPVAYDSERNTAARRRGLRAPYIPGGLDPDASRTAGEERRLLRILFVMVAVIVLGGFVLGILAALLGIDSLVGRPA
jgi:hypothetical protein